jgi:serine/threonine protein kinase
MEEPDHMIGASLSRQLTHDYNLIRLLGKGGMGEVYLAEQVRVGRRLVALKVLNRNCCDNSNLKRRFENEAASAGRIHHRNIVMVYECRATDDGQLYVAMEYVASISASPSSRGGRCRSPKSSRSPNRRRTGCQPPTSSELSTAMLNQTTSCWRATTTGHWWSRSWTWGLPVCPSQTRPARPRPE